MQTPSFTVTKYGIFNSNVRFSEVRVTKDRLIEDYEIEYFPNDCRGLSGINGIDYPLVAGTVSCAKPGQTGRCIVPIRCYYVHIKTDDPTMVALLNQMPDIFVAGKVPELEQLFENILSIENVRDVQNRLRMTSYTCQLINLLMKLKRGKVGADTNIGSRHQEMLLDVEKYIKGHLNEDLSLASLSSYCNLSLAYFQRLFTAYFEKSPNQYILERRIDAAKRLLVVSEYSLSKIAEDCGFASQAYFCCKFKQFTGLTPLQYRKEKHKLMRLD